MLPQKNIELSVLGYIEDGEWVALALDMDLRGYGATPEAAESELMDLVRAQFSFAASREEPGLLWFPAERKYWKMFEEARRDSIQRLSLGTDPTSSHKVGGIPIPVPHAVIESSKARL